MADRYPLERVLGPRLRGFALLVFGLLVAVDATAVARPVTLTIEGQPVAALYWAGAKSSSKGPGVVLLHMLNQSKEDWRSFGDLLERSGYAAIALDLRGGGNAGTPKLLGDARAAFEFLLKQPEVDPARIAIVGASIGANDALAFAVEDPRVRCVVLLSPGLNYHGLTTEPAMARMNRPVLLVASEDDDYSARTARRLNQLGTAPKVLKIYSTGGHGTQILGVGVGLEKEILAFLKARL